jgi:RNA polymerase sigma-70 factor (ECF subfamily)
MDGAEAKPTAATPLPTRISSDKSLLRLIREGNEDAAAKLYGRYAGRLRALIRSRCSAELARRLEPDDIVQSVFRRFFLHARQGDYDVPASEELWGLFLVIALNKLRAEESFFRAEKRDIGRTRDVADPEADGVRAGCDENAEAVLRFTIDETLATLPPTHRPLVEYRIQGHEVAEIARLSGRSKRSVERVLQEFRQRLRAQLEYEPFEVSSPTPP